MRKIKFLGMAIMLLMLPLVANAEEVSNDTSSTTDNTTTETVTNTTDDTVVVKLYEDDSKGKEVYVSGPTKNGDVYVYNAVVEGKDENYYMSIEPNYEYKSITYKDAGANHPIAISDSSGLAPYFITRWWSLHDGGVFYADVTKEDGSVIKYALSIRYEAKTVYVEDMEEKEPVIEQESKVETEVKQETEIKQEVNVEKETKIEDTKKETKEETVTNPDTAVVLGFGSLGIILVALLFLKKKNKFSKI